MKYFQVLMLQSTSRRQWTMYFVALVGACLAILPPGLSAQELTLPLVPPALKVPAGHRPFLLGHASGTQNYICLVAGQPWTFIGPQATLFDDGSEQLITHFFSPNPAESGTVIRAAWQDSKDTSVVWAGLVESSVDANFVKAGAIAWLKLETAGTQDGPGGGDTLSKTTFIQRLNTDGGAAPSLGCDRPTDIGRKAFVPYTADYIFYRK